MLATADWAVGYALIASVVARLRDRRSDSWARLRRRSAAARGDGDFWGRVMGAIDDGTTDHSPAMTS